MATNISRRGLFGALLSLLSWRPREWTSESVVKASRRPWAKRAIELEEEHGVWADFEAFEEWWGEKVNGKLAWAGDFDISLLERIALYSMFCDVADASDGADER